MLTLYVRLPLASSAGMGFHVKRTEVALRPSFGTGSRGIPGATLGAGIEKRR